MLLPFLICYLLVVYNAICDSTQKYLHLGLDVLTQLFELLHVSTGGRPGDAQTLGLIRLRDLVGGD